MDNLLDILGFKEFIDINNEQKAKEAVIFLIENKKILEKYKCLRDYHNSTIKDLIKKQ